jgi:hypothetical protein
MRRPSLAEGRSALIRPPARADHLNQEVVKQMHASESGRVVIPAGAEMEAFFAQAAEQRRRFWIEGPNGDVVLAQPVCIDGSVVRMLVDTDSLPLDPSALDTASGELCNGSNRLSFTFELEGRDDQPDGSSILTFRLPQEVTGGQLRQHRRHRVPGNLRVTAELTRGEAFSGGRIVDVSDGGFQVALYRPEVLRPEVGQEARVSVRFGPDIVDFDGVVRWTNDSWAGVELPVVQADPAAPESQFWKTLVDRVATEAVQSRVA